MNIEKTTIEKMIKEKTEYYCKKFGKEFEIALLEIFSLEKLLTPEPEPEQTEEQEELIPLAKWNEHFDYPSVASLRQTYFNREKNGFSFCVEYGGDNGGRILISVPRYHIWRKKRAELKHSV